MRTKRIKAIFKGEDHSLGFRHGVEYELIISHKKGENINIKNDTEKEILICNYESMVAFLSNWDNIIILK